MESSRDASRDIRVLSLFSGCGGMDIGLEGGFGCIPSEMADPSWVAWDSGRPAAARTAFSTVFANDIRPDAKAAWCRYFSDRGEDRSGMYRLESIVDLVKKAESGEKVFPDGIDLVTGGFPCQDFSVAGKRLGFGSGRSHSGGKAAPGEPTCENRGHLYMWMRDVVTLTSPKLFIAENVKGLTSLSDVQATIEADFRSAGNGGYLVVPARVLRAVDYGVPQSRERVIFFGFRKSALRPEALEALRRDPIPPGYDPYPPESHAPGSQVTLNAALAGLEEPAESSDPSQRAFSGARYMGPHCQGQSEVRLDGAGPTIRSEHHGNIEYRRLSAEHGGVNCTLEGLPERRLTVRECARIQTFPDDYRFVFPPSGESRGVSPSEAYRLIGNAVPCVLAYSIARNLQAKWSRYFREEP